MKYRISDPLQFEVQRFSLSEALVRNLKPHYMIWNLYQDNRQLIFMSERVLEKESAKALDPSEIKAILSEIQRRQNVDILSAISPVCRGMDALYNAYHQVLRLFELACEAGAGLFSLDSIADSDPKRYSSYNEHLVLDTLTRNDAGQLKTSYEKYIRALPSERDDEYLKRCVHHLAMNADLLLRDTYGMTTDMEERFHSLYVSLFEVAAIKMVDMLYLLLQEAVRARLLKQAENMDAISGNYVEKACEYIEENLQDPELSITAVANAVYLNPVYFGRMFKHTLGLSFKRYLMQRRIELAKSLLLNGQNPINTISDMIGFMNPSYFTQIFKQETGVLPSDYKEIKKSEM
ncbi:AraC family transcriptional regulator [Lachnospiraceae bacterium ZAX-1]